MGILRSLLALAVVIEHAGVGKPSLLGGIEAVETFFMISGFYMALILSEKYTGPGSYRLFISNRFLRIYPTYWVVLGMSFIAFVALALAFHLPGPLNIYHALGASAASVLVHAANLLIFGLDLILFLGVNSHGHLYFTADFTHTNPPLYYYSYIPPAWSLSLELMFYVLAPWLLRRRTGWLLAIMLASLLLRGYLYSFAGLRHDPWTYRFFPTELAFFVAGGLAYRVYAHIRDHPIPPWLIHGGAIFFLLLCPVYDFLPIPWAQLKEWIFYLAAWGAIPLLFLAFKSRRWDRQIGELSYPIYVVHFLVLSLMAPIFAKYAVHSLPLFVTVIVAITIFLSVLIDWLVVSPIEAFRQKRVKERREGRPAMLAPGR